MIIPEKDTMRRFAHLILLTLLGICPGQAGERPRDFVAFGFGGLETMPVNDAVNLLMNLGYSGVIPEGRDASDLVRLEEYLDRSESEGDAFNVPAFYLNHKIYNDGYDDSVHREVIDLLAARGGGTIWMAVRAARDQSDPVDFERVNHFIKGVFDYATGEDGDGDYRNVNIVFYPHVNNAYQSTIQALPLVEDINDPRFTVSINLVHEYHAGLSDPASLANTFNQAKGRIGAIILCGIQTTGDFEILSLEDSEHDLEPFIGLIRDSEYMGPVGFINFSIPEDPGDGVGYPEEYLAGSIAEWNTLSSDVGVFEKKISPPRIASALVDEELALRWNSKMGKFYHLFSSTDLVRWTPHNDGVEPYVNIPTSGVGTNELAGIPLQGEQRFFRIVEDIRPSR